MGAFTGEYAELFRKLGGRVVAVEPNPQLAARIRSHFPGLTVEEAAVGAERGEAKLRLGEYEGHSTLSPEWAARFPERWTDEITVRVVTLDELIERHGEPAFVKIDVEGFEADVLRGLTQRVPALVFEYQCAQHDTAFECLGLLSGYQFAVLRSGGTSLGAWGTGEEAADAIREHGRADPVGYGDVFARSLTTS